MPLSANEICELISKRNGDSIRKIEETAGLGKDSLRTAISRGASLSSKSEEKILEAYSFLNPSYVKIGEGSPYIDNADKGTFVPKKPSFETKYLTLLEEIAEERKQKRSSIEDRLDRIEAQNREIIELIKVNSETGNKVAGSLSWNQKVLVKILGHVLAAAEGKDLKEAEKKLNTILLEAHS